MTDPLLPLLVEQTSEARKQAPVWGGFMRYFPRAMMVVAMHSWLSNEKHNPGEPMHWAWDKSKDHGDCIARHQLEPEAIDEQGLPHAVAIAWRAMAQLERLLVEKYGLPLPPAAKGDETST